MFTIGDLGDSASWLTLLRFLGGEAGLYVAVLLSAWGLTRSAARLSPGWRAVGYALPIAITFAVTLGIGSEQAAMGLIFGTSIALLSLVTGLVAISAPLGAGPYRWRRIWPFTTVAAILAFLGGFSGFLNWRCGIVLLLEGAVVLSLWLERSRAQIGADEASFGSAHGRIQAIAHGSIHLPPKLDWIVHWWPTKLFAVVAAIALAILGAFAALKSGLELQARQNVPLVATTTGLISMALVLPLVYWARRLALQRQSWSPLTSHAGVIMINLCLLLPALAGAPYVHALLSRGQGGPPSAMPYPLTVWRIDAVVLILLAFIQVGLSTGKWRLGRAAGFLLILGYCAFVLFVMTPV